MDRRGEERRRKETRGEEWTGMDRRGEEKRGEKRRKEERRGEERRVKNIGFSSGLVQVTRGCGVVHTTIHIHIHIYIYVCMYRDPRPPSIFPFIFSPRHATPRTFRRRVRTRPGIGRSTAASRSVTSPEAAGWKSNDAHDVMTVSSPRSRASVSTTCTQICRATMGYFPGPTILGTTDSSPDNGSDIR